MSFSWPFWLPIHRYDRYMGKVKSAGSPSKASPQAQPAIPPPQRPPQQTPEVSLIDLADDTPSAQLASLSKTKFIQPPPDTSVICSQNQISCWYYHLGANIAWNIRGLFSCYLLIMNLLPLEWKNIIIFQLHPLLQVIFMISLFLIAHVFVLFKLFSNGNHKNYHNHISCI